ncbi:hypothetical protein HEN11_007415, partial [Escherichia coli]|nr:hypothetical protein [Escherichia coli]
IADDAPEKRVNMSSPEYYTISSYIMQQTALQASYKAFTDMQGLSLFQLNK